MISLRPKASSLGGLAAAALGAVTFLLWGGPRLLDPTNVGWLQVGDRALHTIGWWYFRSSPWGMPPGLNPRNGLEISNSVALSDSLPLFALPFKLFAPILPATFQYWGYWLLLSMVLQAVFAWLLARELKLSNLASLIFAAFALLTPSVLIQQQVHMALAGHWVILAALYLYARETPPPRWFWPLLLAVTAGIHGYLLAMVLAIWVASLLQRGLLSWGVAVETLLGIAGIVTVLWTAGFLTITSFGAAGFGHYSLNLLALFMPESFSLLLPGLPAQPYDYEGLAFPGMGALLLVALALLVGFPGLRAIFRERWVPLLLVVVAMLIFAISNRPALGDIELGTIPLPATLLRFAAIFRASGRMVWPATYLLLLVAFVLLDRRIGARRLAAIAGIAFAIQAVDISGGFFAFARETARMPHDWSTPMRSPFWDAAAARYTKVRAIPVDIIDSNWLDLSHYAAGHGMGSDAAYLGRVDFAAFAKLEAKARAALDTGDFEPDALYVLDLPTAVLARSFARPADLLGRVDNAYVFARGGADLATVANGVSALPSLDVLAVGETADFRTPRGGRFAPAGFWVTPEDWGAAIPQPNGNFAFHLPDGQSHVLRLTLATDTSSRPDATPPLVDIRINGHLAATTTVPVGKTIATEMPIPAGGMNGDVVISFTTRIPTDPAIDVDTLQQPGVVSMALLPPA